MFTQYNPDALRAYCRSIYGDKRLLLTPQIYSDRPSDTLDDGVNGGNIQITQNADFILLGYAIVALGAGGLTIPTIQGTIMFSDSGSGEQFMSRAAMFQNCLTTPYASMQHTLHWPRFIGGNSSVAYSFTNLSGETLTDIFMSIIGFNIREYA